MSDDIDDIDDPEELRREIEETERRLRELRIERQRKEAELRCLEYIDFRAACEEAVQDKPTMYPGTDPSRN